MALAARVAPGVALVLLAGLAYVPALEAGFIWDDDAYVLNNPNLSDARGLWRSWSEPTASPQFYPLVFTTFWAERHLWGLRPFGYHLTNVLLHGLNGALAWRVLRRLGVPAPWFVAAAFVLHPVQVESVAWVTERKNVLSAAFYLAAALAWFRFSPPEPLAGPSRERRGWYALALLLYLGALLSKTVSCSLPAGLVLVLWWRRGKFPWRDAAALGPFFALGVALALVTVWMERYHVGTTAGPDWDFTLTERCLIAGRALCFYAEKLCWPADLTFLYPRWHIDAGAAWQYLFPAAALAAPLVCWLGRRYWGGGPLVACLYFAGTLFPALGFIDVYPMRFSFVADHFQYLASLGPLALLAAAGRAALRRLAVGPWVAPAAGGMVLAVLGVLTWSQAGAYASLETIWRDTLRKNPDCWMAHNSLGEVLFEQGKVREARRHYQEAVRLAPRDWRSTYNLGKACWTLGDVGEAVRAFEAALRLEPDFAEAHFNLGLALLRQKRAPEAIEHLRAAVRLRPDFTLAHNNLGVALARQGKHAEAVAHFEAAARADPGDPSPCYNLALAYRELGRRKEAVESAREAAARNPADPRFRQLLEALLEGK
jgi:tetratricopeptide (TPR) repeat protein